VIIAYYAIMNLELFQIFIDVYRHQSFVEVAKRNCVASSSITRGIAQLENEFGVRLFHRTTRKVSPTEEGEEFYKRILPILEELSHIKEKSSDKLTKATLKITSNVSFCHTLLNEVIIKFKKKYPQINVELLLSDQYVDLITERVDLAVRFGKLVDSSFIGSKLFELKYVLCASPSYLKNKSIQKPEDLKNYESLGFLISNYGQSWKFRKKGQVVEIQINPHVKVIGALSLIDFTLSGLGVAVLPKFMIRKELEKKKLIPLLQSYEVTPTEFDSAAWLLYPSREFVPTKVQLFSNFLKDYLKTKEF
tara:strand:+ start:1032 stop:1949 length:918 start_codon:yes stop_codon:yes gene_type:complete